MIFKDLVTGKYYKTLQNKYYITIFLKKLFNYSIPNVLVSSIAVSNLVNNVS